MDKNHPFNPVFPAVLLLAREPQAPKGGKTILWPPMLKTTTTDILRDRKKKRINPNWHLEKKNLAADLHSKKINKPYNSMYTTALLPSPVQPWDPKL